MYCTSGSMFCSHWCVRGRTNARPGGQSLHPSLLCTLDPLPTLHLHAQVATLTVYSSRGREISPQLVYALKPGLNVVGHIGSNQNFANQVHAFFCVPFILPASFPPRNRLFSLLSREHTHTCTYVRSHAQTLVHTHTRTFFRSVPFHPLGAILPFSVIASVPFFRIMFFYLISVSFFPFSLSLPLALSLTHTQTAFLPISFTVLAFLCTHTHKDTHTPKHTHFFCHSLIETFALLCVFSAFERFSLSSLLVFQPLSVEPCEPLSY